MNLLEASPVLKEIPGLLEDHLQLARLEFRQEQEAGRRRLPRLALAALFLLTAWTVAQAAALQTLQRWGVSLEAACWSLAALWTLVGAGLYFAAPRRDPKLGEPFEGTREELRKSLTWIRTIFS